jgi:SAM-dependent methyltransferase
MTDPRSDIVNQQYEKWTYPFPVEDLEAWRVDNWDRMDPSHAQPMLWPDREYRPDMDILIAGCGTNQAAELAFMNRGAKVLGIDISQSSLRHQEYLKDKHGLDNLELQLLPIEELPTLAREFDLIISTGVLHHMADPLAGLRSLAACIRPDGVIGLMLYAKHGRIGVNLLQSAFQDLGLQQDEESVRLVRGILKWLPAEHYVRSYLAVANDVSYDAGLVDTFLHGREHTYTVEDCFEFVEAAGLVFQDWVDMASYYIHDLAVPDDKITADLLSRGLPDRMMWSLMDRLRTQNGCHYFLACRPDRPKSSYTLDFTSLESLDYVPSMRMGVGIVGTTLIRPTWRWDKADATAVAFMRHTDGQRTLREIAAMLQKEGLGPQNSVAAAEKHTRKLCQSLRQLDFISVRKPPRAQRI